MVRFELLSVLVFTTATLVPPVGGAALLAEGSPTAFDILIRAVEQVPALGVMAFVWWVFLKYQRESNAQFDKAVDRLSSAVDRSSEKLSETMECNTKVLGRLESVIETLVQSQRR